MEAMLLVTVAIMRMLVWFWVYGNYDNQGPQHIGHMATVKKQTNLQTSSLDDMTHVKRCVQNSTQKKNVQPFYKLYVQPGKQLQTSPLRVLLHPEKHVLALI